MIKPGRSEVLIELVRERGWKRGVELGVYRGENLYRLMRACPALLMVGIDLWAPYGSGVRQDKVTGETTYNNTEAREAYRLAKSVQHEIGDRLTLIQCDTVLAAANFDAETFDFVFIDADHKTLSVIQDIEAWRPKIKPGGALLGHDSNWTSVRQALATCFGDWWAQRDANVWIHEWPRSSTSSSGSGNQRSSTGRSSRHSTSTSPVPWSIAGTGGPTRSRA